MDVIPGLPPPQGLYDPSREHDACGVGFVAHIKGRKSHDIVENGLTILKNLRHRGATGADPLHGDGAGILIQIPDAFFREEMGAKGVKLPKAGAYGVGMVFLPRKPAARAACVREVERAIVNEGQVLLGWRDVPVKDSCLGETARGTMPIIRQVFVGAGRGTATRSSGSSTSSARPPAMRSAPWASRTRRASTSPRSRIGPSSTRACCSQSRSASSTAT
jgi:glutamate synthase (NADPH) large chain